MANVFACRLACLLDPGSKRIFVEQVVFVDVEVAHFFLLGLAGRDRMQRPAADVFRKAMDAEEPALSINTI